MKIEAKTAEEYISKVEDSKRTAFDKLYATVASSIDPGFTSMIQYGFPSFVVSLEKYPEGYHCTPNTPLPFVSIGAQKNFLALYHMGLYADQELLDWFVTEYPKHTKYKLDMGKSCIRFKRMDDIPFTLIAELMNKMKVDRWVELYESKFKK